MLLRYYLASIIFGIALLMIGSPLWALLPLVLIVIFASDSFNSRSNVQSLQQFFTNNVMLFSWIALLVGVVWIMNLLGYDVLYSVIIMSIFTILGYFFAFGTKYEDGVDVLLQSSVLSIAIVIVVSLAYMIVWNTYYVVSLGLLTMYLIAILCLLVFYAGLARIFVLPQPDVLIDWITTLGVFIIPVASIIVFSGSFVLLGLLGGLLWYMLIARILQRLTERYQPSYNHETITLDLILKGYTTSASRRFAYQGVTNVIVERLQGLQLLYRSMIGFVPDLLLVIGYFYVFFGVFGEGLRVLDFGLYCILFVGYVALSYLYKSNTMLHIDNIAQSFVLGYLTIIVLLFSVFANDPVSGGIVGMIWVVVNSLLITQYRPLHLDEYVQRHHVKRWVWANTFAAGLVVLLLFKIPFEGIIMIPVSLVVLAILGFTVAQSYSTLRTLNEK